MRKPSTILAGTAWTSGKCWLISLPKVLEVMDKVISSPPLNFYSHCVQHHGNYAQRCCLFKLGNEQAAKHRPWLVLWLHCLADCYTFLDTLLVEYTYQVWQVPESPSSVTDGNLILQNMPSVLYTIYKRETNLIKCDISFNGLSLVHDGRWVVPEYSCLQEQSKCGHAQLTKPRP